MSRTLVVGDVHGCADELAALLDHASPDRVVSVGDLFTRGPDPVGVWDLVRGSDAVLGNHDEKVLAPEPGGHAAAVADALDRADPRWRAWVAGLPLFLEVGRFTVVHAGLHPSGSLDHTTRRMALTMRRWPDEAPDRPFWWQVYAGDRAVLFGHDAARGHHMVDWGEDRWLVALDSGCVYGGALTGFCVEEERVYAVPARRAYAPMRPIG